MECIHPITRPTVAEQDGEHAEKSVFTESMHLMSAVPLFTLNPRSNSFHSLMRGVCVIYVPLFVRFLLFSVDTGYRERGRDRVKHRFSIDLFTLKMAAMLRQRISLLHYFTNFLISILKQQPRNSLAKWIFMEVVSGFIVNL